MAVSRTLAAFMLAVAAAAIPRAAAADTVVLFDPALWPGSNALIPNGDFGAGSAGWTYEGSGGYFAIVTGAPFESWGRVARATDSRAALAGYRWSREVAVVPHTEYVVGGFFNTEHIAPGGSLYIEVEGGTGTVRVQGPAATEGWFFAYANFNPGDATAVTFRMGREGLLRPGDYGLVDNLSLTPALSFHGPVPVPEPSSAALIGLGLGGLIAARIPRRATRGRRCSTGPNPAAGPRRPAPQGLM